MKKMGGERKEGIRTKWSFYKRSGFKLEDRKLSKLDNY